MIRLSLVVPATVAVLMLTCLGCGSAPSSTGGTGGGAAGGGETGAGGGSSGVAGGAKGEDCGWLVTCIDANQCSTQACLDQCGAQASSTAIDQYNALVACILANSQCTDGACLEGVCSAQVSACWGSAVSGDGGVSSDAGVVVIGPHPTSDGGAVLVVDGGAGGAGGGGGGGAGGGGGSASGYTTSGSCRVQTKNPSTGAIISDQCNDYTLTATSAYHNDGSEHYVAYLPINVTGVRDSACQPTSASGAVSGPWDPGAISASNASHRKAACDLAAQSPYNIVTWTDGALCTLSGSLGHCTLTVTNVWDPSTQVLTGSLSNPTFTTP